jgi:hypothetical protein
MLLREQEWSIRRWSDEAGQATQAIMPKGSPMNLGADHPFQDVREQEAEAREQHARYQEGIRIAIALADGLLQLEATAGWKHLQKTFTDLLEFRTRALLSARDDRSAAVLQGQCMELKSVLSMMANARGNRDALAHAAKEEEDRFLDLERSFKPQSPSETT